MTKKIPSTRRRPLNDWHELIGSNANMEDSGYKDDLDEELFCGADIDDVDDFEPPPWVRDLPEDDDDFEPPPCEELCVSTSSESFHSTNDNLLNFLQEMGILDI